MGWDIKEDGFGVVLSPELPALMRNHLGPVVTAFLDSNHLSLEEIRGLLFHPGGRKVLETAEEVLDVPRARLAHSWAVLRDFGNMSSATALFVLERALAAGERGRIFSLRSARASRPTSSLSISSPTSCVPKARRPRA
jgi:alkylresorcinol/alkylpyrone synthase